MKVDRDIHFREFNPTQPNNCTYMNLQFYNVIRNIIRRVCVEIVRNPLKEKTIYDVLHSIKIYGYHISIFFHIVILLCLTHLQIYHSVQDKFCSNLCSSFLASFSLAMCLSVSREVN